MLVLAFKRIMMTIIVFTFWCRVWRADMLGTHLLCRGFLSETLGSVHMCTAWYPGEPEQASTDNLQVQCNVLLVHSFAAYETWLN